MHREREALGRHTDALQMTLMQSKGQGGVGRDSTPAAVLKKVGEGAMHCNANTSARAVCLLQGT